ncbi:hypothetical protein Q0Z83_022910 [Actinoplanes sichuanensis]|nr:hypothetical protein Q0Z83_022910 [Actinoplanes sichuanensis]
MREDQQVTVAGDGLPADAGEPDLTGEDVMQRHGVAGPQAYAPRCPELDPSDVARGDPDVSEQGGGYVGG